MVYFSKIFILGGIENFIQDWKLFSKIEDCSRKLEILQVLFEK
jgi:hypothetical protein